MRNGNTQGWDGWHPGLTVWNFLSYTRIENEHEVRKKILIFYNVAVICTITKVKKRHGLVWAVTINPPEMPINDEARNEAHIASTGARLYYHKKRNGN